LSDKQFSVDDILNQYSKKREEKPKQKDTFDLDEFIISSRPSSQPKKKSKQFEVDLTHKSEDYQISKQPPEDKTISLTPPKETDIKPVIAKKPAEIVKASPPPIDENEEVDFVLTKAISRIKEKKANQKRLQNDEYLEKAATSFGNNLNIPVEETPIKPIRRNSGNTEIIEGLLKMKREKVSSRTTELTPINRKNINDIELDIKSKIIPKTAQLSINAALLEDEKMNMLTQRRNKKIRDFVLSTGEEDDVEGDFVEDNCFQATDFEKFEDAPAVARDIGVLKGTLIVRFCFLLMAALLSIYISVANDFNWPIIDILNLNDKPASFLFIHIVLGLLSAFVSYTVIANGFKNFYKLNADADSLSAFAIISSLFASFAMLANTELMQSHRLHIYIPIAIMALMFNTLGKIFIVNRTERNFKFISGDNEKYALFQVDDENTATKFTKGAICDFPSLSSMKKTEFVNNFLTTSYSADLSDTYCKYAVPTTVLVSLISTLLSIFMNRADDISNIIFIAFSTFAGTIAICSSFTLMLVTNIPLSKASKKYLEASACMLGYPAVDEFAETNSVLLDVGQLFPEGSVDLVNLKQLSSTSIEEGILVAASLSCQAGSILKSTFYKMLRGKTEMLYPVESYIYEDTLGLSGWIENKRVLLGTRDLMTNHSIEGLPSTAKEREYAKSNSLVLYLSISGEVTTMFVIQISASHGITKWLKEIEKQNITIVLRSVDSIISLNFLSEIFDVSPECFKLIPFRFHKSFDEQTTYVPNITSSMVCSGKFQSFAMLITGAKRLQKTARIGVALILASAVLGGLLSIILTVLSSFSQLTTSVLLFYNLAWLAVIVAVQAYRKT